jgi:glycosyltransferase involved in cell wall biosynthesis
MRILLHGQALWSKSAYGHQIRMALQLLKSQGHTVGQACTFGFWGRNMLMNDISMYPALNDAFANDVIPKHAEHFGADYVMSLGDMFAFDPDVWGNGFKWLAWVTVDSSPLWSSIKAVLPKATRVIAYSQYGQRVLQSAGFDADYIPLVFDPEVYYPVPMAEARAATQFPTDRYIVGIVQANRTQDNRKNFFEQIEAFRKFQKKHPDAFLYLHTCMSARRGGFDLVGFCEELGMVEGQDYGATDEYIETTLGISDEDMRNVYSSIDVLLQATKAEGFGVPALEASACEKPVVYTDYAALPEAVHLGYKVEHELEWQSRWNSWYARPIQASIVDALERAYSRQEYDLNRGYPTTYMLPRVAMDHWTPFMERMAEQLQPEAMAA